MRFRNLAFLVIGAAMVSGCLAPKNLLGSAAGYGRSYPEPIIVSMPPNAPSITQQFRDTDTAEDPRWEEHYGLDVHAPTGTPVIAAAGGTVVRSYWGPAYGNQITVRHAAKPSEQPSFTRYVHLQRRMAKVGDVVSRGEQVGTLGASGVLAGGFPHLHFETRRFGNDASQHAQDPHLFWADGIGRVTCYEAKHNSLDETAFLMTYPVPCQ